MGLVLVPVGGIRRWCVVGRRALGVVVSLSLVFPTHAAATKSTSAEYRIKAAFLYNFAKFVKWPAASFMGPRAPLGFCTAGDDPFGGALDEAIKDKQIDGHVLVVKRSGSLRECHVVFINSHDEKFYHATLSVVRGTSALTVGERKGFLQSGGMVNFLIEDNKVRFEINDAEARQSGLQMSSHLLALAKLVITQADGSR